MLSTKAHVSSAGHCKILNTSHVMLPIAEVIGYGKWQSCLAAGRCAGSSAFLKFVAAANQLPNMLRPALGGLQEAHGRRFHSPVPSGQQGHQQHLPSSRRDVSTSACCVQAMSCTALLYESCTVRLYAP